RHRRAGVRRGTPGRSARPGLRQSCHAAPQVPIFKEDPMQRCVPLCLAALLAAVVAAAAEPKPTETGQKTGLIPRQVRFGNPDRASPQLSPDGKYLSFLAPVKGVLNVWVGPADSPKAAEPVTADKKRGIRIYSWAHTNQHVLYLQDQDGDEN